MLFECCLQPDWPAPSTVKALSTTRLGGVSVSPYASLNLGCHVGDDPVAVAENRRCLRALLPGEPCWLSQVHGTEVIEADGQRREIEADASFTRVPGCVCAVQTADCLPVLFCDRGGSVVAAAHAGWRGLAAGVLENTILAMDVPPSDILAWLGPAIGPQFFEVGDDVREAFVATGEEASAAFVMRSSGKWLADIFLLARQRLLGAGVSSVFGGGLCTFSDSTRFYSYRRDRVCGRMATLIWLDPA